MKTENLEAAIPVSFRETETYTCTLIDLQVYEFDHSLHEMALFRMNWRPEGLSVPRIGIIGGLCG
jgi:hypothetical protein